MSTNFVCLPTAINFPSDFLVISTVAKASFFPFLMHSDFISRTSPALAALKYLEGIESRKLHHTKLNKATVGQGTFQKGQPPYRKYPLHNSLIYKIASEIRTILYKGPKVSLIRRVHCNIFIIMDLQSVHIMCHGACMGVYKVTYEMFISTLTPGLLLAVTMANVEMLSTKVAVNPPCRVPPMFKCDSSTVISHTHCPCPEETNCTCTNRARSN